MSMDSQQDDKIQSSACSDDDTMDDGIIAFISPQTETALEDMDKVQACPEQTRQVK